MNELIDTSNETLSISQIVSGWKTVKRNGKTVDFDYNRLINAIDCCFRISCGRQDVVAATQAKQIAKRVVNVLSAKGQTVWKVEEVQDHVIQQLWAEGEFEAATQYTIYREERRKKRIASRMSEEVLLKIEEDRKRFKEPIQYFQYLDKFARWREEDKRREVWPETCDRVFGWLRALPKVKLRDDEWKMLYDHMFDMKASPAMRVVQMAGPALERCNVGCYNCATLPIKDLFSFCELLYILMQGSGVGFSVERHYVNELPEVKRQKKDATKKKFVIPDSTEGWCEAVHEGLKTWFAGEDIEYDASKVRPKGSKLKTKGGRSSGPEPLLKLLAFIRETVLGAQGRQLTPLECHDIACFIGDIVQVGGVRRSSCISLSDLNDVEMRDCKSGKWWEKNKQRSMSNNSAVYESKPDQIAFMREWLALAESGSGERGIYNRQAVNLLKPIRRKEWRFQTNPCGEIQLRPYQFCNLSIVVARPDDTEETLIKKVIAATYFGCMQKTATRFGYIRDEWKKNSEEEALIGVDINGQMDCPLLRPGAPGRKELLAKLRKIVREVDIELSARFGVNESAANTTVKPSGDSSEFFQCSPGVHVRYAKHQIRTCRVADDNPLGLMLRDTGLTCHDEVGKSGMLRVIEFLKEAPDGCPTRDDMTAIEQLENWLFWQENWAEHSVSCSVYIDEHEWIEAGKWVYDHFDKITGLSFFPKAKHVYQNAPNQPLTEEVYKQRLATFPEINWSKLAFYEDEDKTTSSQEYACAGGACSML